MLIEGSIPSTRPGGETLSKLHGDGAIAAANIERVLMTFQNQAGQRIGCNGPLDCRDMPIVLALPLGHSRQSPQFGKPCNAA